MKKMKFSLLLLLFPILIFSQEKALKGKVTDETGVPLIGVTIIIKGTNKGTVTDFNGNYELSYGTIKSGVLRFGYVGYSSKEIEFDENSTVTNVVLSESQEQLDEVVVTALGIKRDKKSLSYAVQEVATEDMNEARTSNFLNALSGKAAGVQVVNSGTPTGSTRVIIRGLTSISGNNQPLFIVDGVTLDREQGDDNVSVWNGGQDIDYGNPISQINPNDIESIQVLKGANAAALYGSRAANGVVLITTKKGKTTDNKLGITVSSNLSMVSNREYPNYQYAYGSGQGGRLVLNPSQIDNETGLPLVGAYTRAYGLPFDGQDVISYNGELGKYLPNVNNVKDLYQVGTVSTNNFAIAKGNEKGSFRFSYENVKGNHVIANSEIQNRHNFTLRASRKVSEKLELNTSVLYTNDEVKNRLYQNGSERNPANNYMYIRPDMSSENLLPYKDEAGFSFNYNGPFNNPYWNLYENSNKDETNRIIGNVTLNWKISNKFNLRTRINGVVNVREGEEFNNVGAPYDPNGLYRVFNNTTKNLNYEGVLNYTDKFGDFSLVSLVGANRFDRRVTFNQTRLDALSVAGVKSLINQSAEADPVLTQRANDKRINSVFASSSLGFKKTYFLDVTVRNDWSSTLPPENNSYFYSSFGATAIFTEWLPRNEVITYGKLRGSYAEVGNDTEPYNIYSRYQFGGNYNNTSWVRLESLKKNSTLKPESTASTEFGLETKLFRNKISLNATYYKSSTTNQIIPLLSTPTSGFTRQIVNAGEIQNKGWEVFLSANIVDKAFKWTADFNWSTNETLVVSLIDDVNRLPIRNWFNVAVYAEEGQPFGNIRGNSQARDPETGTPLVKANGRVEFDNDVLLGNAQPDWIGSIRNSFSYKNFTLNFLIDVKKGGDLYSATMLKTVNHGIHSETVAGRDDFLLSSVILGENNNERRGVGLFGNDYADVDRPKGAQYEGAAFSERDADGNWVAQRDANGDIVYANVWLSPELYGYDGISDQTRFVYDASYVKLRELTLGYVIPQKLIKKTPFKNVKLSVVGRDLWTIYRNTPQGIDPEAGTTAQNGQGIEYGSFLPTRTVGLNVKLGF